MAKQNLIGATMSKTVWFGLGVAIFGFLQTQGDVWGEFVNPKYAGLLNMGFGIVVIVLRFLTTVPLSEKVDGNTGD